MSLQDFPALRAQVDSLSTAARDFAMAAVPDLPGAMLRGLDESLQHMQTGRFQVAFIGQIKVGKSTLVNAMLFGSEVLPVATTVQTAKLAVVSRGEAPGAVVEFYSVREWQDLKERAADEVRWTGVGAGFDEAVDAFAAKAGAGTRLAAARDRFGIEEKVSLARIISDAKQQLGEELGGLLGTRRAIDIETLEDYVAVRKRDKRPSRYTSVTRSVQVQYPHDWPDEVEFVDTPGMNDANPVHERVTSDYLHRADAVIFVTSRDRNGNLEDIRLLKGMLLHGGFSKVIIAVNKCDDQAERGRRRDELRAVLAKNLPEESIAGSAGAFNLDLIFPVSGARCLLGRSHRTCSKAEFLWKDVCKGIEDDESAVQTSGVPELEGSLAKFLMQNKGVRLLVAPLRKARTIVEAAVDSTGKEIEREQRRLEHVGKSMEQLALEERRLTEKVATMKARMDAVKADLNSWVSDPLERTRGEMAFEAEESTRQLAKQYGQRIEQLGALDLTMLSAPMRDLNNSLAWDASEIAQRITRKFEETVRTVKQRLRTDFAARVRLSIEGFDASGWMRELVDRIGRTEVEVVTPDVSIVEDFRGFWVNLGHLFHPDAARQELRRRLDGVLRDFDAKLQDYARDTADGLRDRICANEGQTFTNLTAHADEQVKDLQAAMQQAKAGQLGQKASEEACRRRIADLNQTLGALEGKSAEVGTAIADYLQRANSGKKDADGAGGA